MKQETSRRSGEANRKALAFHQIDPQRMAERAREIRARYMRRFIKSTVRALVRFGREYKHGPIRITDSGGKVTLGEELLVPSLQRAYRG